MLENYELRCFLSLAKSLSFAVAAKEQNISSPQLSKVIARLEDKLGRKLFARTTRSVRLTKEAERFLPLARQTVETATQATDFFQNEVGLEGTIRLTAPFTLMHRVITPKIAAFRKLHPQVNFEFTLSDSYLDLIDHNLDLAFRIMPLNESSLMAKKIGTNELVFCTSPEFLSKNQKITNINQLKNHGFLAIAPHYNLKFQKCGKKLSQIVGDPWIKSTNGDVLLKQVQISGGVLLRSRWSVEEELKKGTLKELKLNDKIESNTAIYIVYPPNPFLPARVRAFIDFF